MLKGGAGADTLDGGAGVDTADYRDKSGCRGRHAERRHNATVKVGGVAEDTIRNIENVIGGTAGDTLTGDGLANVLAGGAATTSLKGGRGADTLDGGAGVDTADYRDQRDPYGYAQRRLDCPCEMKLLAFRERGQPRFHQLACRGDLHVDRNGCVLRAADLVDAGLPPAGARLEPEDRRNDRLASIAGGLAVEVLSDLGVRLHVAVVQLASIVLA